MTANTREGTATAGLPAAERVTVGTAAGWGPMLLTVQAAEADPAAAQIVVDADVVMATDEPDIRIFEQVALSWGPNWLWLDRGRSRLPVIAPHGSAAARLVFPLDPAGLLRSADGMPGLAEASLVLAGGWTDHTVVPFGAGPAALNRPTEIAVGGTLTTPTVTLTVLGGRVSMGRLGDWTPPDHERAMLHFTYDVTAAEDAPFPGVFPERRLMLRLPDGSSVRAGDGSPFDLLVDPGDTVTGAVVGFPVVLPVAGDYQLQLGTDTLDFPVAATGFAAPPWTSRPLVPRTPACVQLSPPSSGRAGIALDRAFAVGAITARLCEVAHDGETLWATLALTNPSRHRLEVVRRLGALQAVGGELARPVGAQVTGSDLPSGGSGMVRLRFDGVTALDGLRLAVDAGQARDLVALDPNASDETDTLGIPVAVSGDLHAAGTLVRVRDAAVLAGTFDDALDLAPDGHRHLVVRFDFFARGAVPVSSGHDLSEDGEEFLTLYGFAAPGPFTLTTPDGSELVPVRVTPVNPTAYPREQLRGVVTHFEVPAPVAGSYRLTYAFQDKSASLDIDIPRERGR